MKNRETKFCNEICFLCPQNSKTFAIMAGSEQEGVYLREDWDRILPGQAEFVDAVVLSATALPVLLIGNTVLFLDLMIFSSSLYLCAMNFSLFTHLQCFCLYKFLYSGYYNEVEIS